MPNGLEKAVDLAQNLGGILALVFYVAIVLWTYKDARRRIDDPILIATAVACSMLPIVGVLVYMMLRPPEYLDDVRERELEIRAMERTLGMQERCPNCRSHIESNFLACPICMYKLRQPCITCDQPLDPRWSMCPFCETQVAERDPVVRNSPRGRSSSGRSGASSSGTSAKSSRGSRGGTEPAAGSSKSTSKSGSGSGSTANKRSSAGSKSAGPKADRSSDLGIDTEPLTPDQPTMAMTTAKSEKDK